MIFHTRTVQIQSPVWNHPTQEVKGKFIWRRQAQWHFLQLVILKSFTSFGTKKIIFFILSFKGNQNHKRDKDSRVIHLFFKMLSPEVSWFALKHSGVPLARGLFIVFFLIKEDCFNQRNTDQMSTENCASINPNKMPCHKKAIENYFYPPPILPVYLCVWDHYLVCRSAGMPSLWRFSRKSEIPQEKDNGHRNYNVYGCFSDSVASDGYVWGKWCSPVSLGSHMILQWLLKSPAGLAVSFLTK